jgi:hypothetical protein
MNSISYTSLAGYARLAVILVGFGFMITGRVTIEHATAAVLFIIGLIGSAGLIKAQDTNAPQVIQSTSITPAHGDTPAKIETSVTPPTEGI